MTLHSIHSVPVAMTGHKDWSSRNREMLEIQESPVVHHPLVHWFANLAISLSILKKPDVATDVYLTHAALVDDCYGWFIEYRDLIRAYAKYDKAADSSRTTEKRRREIRDYMLPDLAMRIHLLATVGEWLRRVKVPLMPTSARAELVIATLKATPPVTRYPSNCRVSRGAEYAVDLDLLVAIRDALGGSIHYKMIAGLKAVEAPTRARPSTFGLYGF